MRARESSPNTWPWAAPLIPPPIHHVLSTIRGNGTRTLLMGGQACVFYGAAQVSKDVDFVILADQANLASLRPKRRRDQEPVFETARGEAEGKLKD